MAELQLAPRNWISRDFNVLQHGVTIAMIVNASIWKDKAVLEINGASYDLARERQMSGDFLLQQGGNPLARARKPSVLRSSFLIAFGGKQYTLKKTSFWGRAFQLMEEDRQVGLVAPAGIFSRKANVSLPDDWPLPIQVFTVWLVLILWQREQSAAAAGASAH